jgi:hypothetical protein
MQQSNGPRSAPAALLVALLALSGCLGGFWTLRRTPAASEGRVTNRPNQVEEDGYVSSRACRSCHPSEYASWHGSYHRTMTQVATPQTVVPSFDGIRIDNVYGSAVRLERQGDEFLANFADPDWNEPAGDRPQIRRKVDDHRVSQPAGVIWYETGQIACSVSCQWPT